MKEETKVARGLKRVELAVRRAFLGYLSLSKRLRAGSRVEAERTARALLPALLNGSPTILFLRQDRLGDAIVTTPLLVALHQAYPNAKIIMLLGTNNRAIVELLPIKCETAILTKDPRADRVMTNTLRERGVDILIDLTDNASVTSSLLIKRIKPKVAIGIEKSNAVVYDILVPRLDPSSTHISRRIAELLRPLGIDPSSIDRSPKLRLPSMPHVAGRVGINISAGASSRYAPSETYAEIARRIALSSDTTEVRILAAPEDQELAAHIVRLANSDKVIGQDSALTFAQFGAYLGTCDIIITPDTSIVHLGAAAGVPMVVIYAPIPEGLCYWTPTGVPYEMMVQRPSLSSLEPEPVIALFNQLKLRQLQLRLAAEAVKTT